MPINWSAQNETARGPLTRPIALKSTRFALTCITGPLGFLYVSPTLGTVAILLFVVSPGIHFGLVAIDSAWALPQVLVARSAAPYLLWASFGISTLFLAFACSGFVNERNLAIRTGNLNQFGTFQKARCCLEYVSLIFGALLIIPWVLSDLLVAIFSLGRAEFLVGGIYFLCPHALAALLSYSVAVSITGWLISKKQ
jgi:hypothetical protein